MKERILVTGALGQLGLNLIKKLESQYKLFLLDLPSQISKHRAILNKSNDLTFIGADLTNNMSLKNSFNKTTNNFDYLIHLASLVDPSNNIGESAKIGAQYIKQLHNETKNSK